MKFKEFIKSQPETNPILKWLIKYWKIILWIFVAGYLYSAIHEIVHYKILEYFGYSAKFCWFCIPTRVEILTPLEQVMRNHYFIVASAPYVLSLFLIFILTILFLIYKKKILLVFALTPFFDTFVNAITLPISYLTKTAGDFLNLFRIGFIWETFVIMLSPIIMFGILYLNYKKQKNEN